MSTVRVTDFITIEEYLAGEQDSPVRHEYVAGLVYAKVGARNVHNLIASNVLGLAFSGLQGQPCQAFNSDTKIRVRLSDQTRFYYPDASIVCQPNPQDDVYQDFPSIVFEVLSDSTRRTDESEKRDAYLSIPSLTHYVMFEQTAAIAIVYEREPNGFNRRVIKGLTTSVAFPELQLNLSLAAVYDGVEFTSDGLGE